MPSPLQPAKLAFAADGTPFSEAYGDVYHSAAGGLGQARHVFLAGNGLPGRWRGRRRFTVLETGFGFGLSFLATWRAWRDDPERCGRLHFVSVEKHPFATPDLARLWERNDELKRESGELLARWPMLVPGMHRLEFEGGRVVLTLLFGDVADGLPQLSLSADAFFLDGFAPAKNPQMWDPLLMRQLARAAAGGATLATWSASAAVRSALADAGFAVEKTSGFGPKRDMLTARLIRPGAPAQPERERAAIVVGAGISGAAVCERLAARGWQVTLLERQAPPAGPGRHAGVFHPIATRDDSLFARLTRAGFLTALARWRALEAAGHAPVWDACGVLQLARDEREADAQRAAMAELALPAEYAQLAGRDAAAALAGVPVAAGGIWYPSGGWIRPLSLVRAQLASSTGRIDARFGCEVARIAREGGVWCAYDPSARLLAQAPVLVLANAADAMTLAPSRAARVRRVRGQISFLPAAHFAPPRMVVLRGGFVLPALEGESIVGASYDFDDGDPTARADSHEGNLERLNRILPGAGAGFDPAALEGMVGFRAVAPDRLPLIGALPDESVEAPRSPRPATLPRLEGLYGAFAFGSRGLLWAGLGAELLASMLEGEPLPIERRLADALDPARFLLRALQRYQRSSFSSS